MGCDVQDEEDVTMVEAEAVVVVGENVTVTRWVDLEGEDVCAQYTHTATSKYGRSSSSYADRDDYYGEKNTAGKPIARGVLGLQNLGNTCYMNSVLQCLSNTYALTEFFTSNRYKSQVNTDNILGHKGKVAQVRLGLFFGC